MGKGFMDVVADIEMARAFGPSWKQKMEQDVAHTQSAKIGVDAVRVNLANAADRPALEREKIASREKIAVEAAEARQMAQKAKAIGQGQDLFKWAVNSGAPQHVIRAVVDELGDRSPLSGDTAAGVSDVVSTGVAAKTAKTVAETRAIPVKIAQKWKQLSQVDQQIADKFLFDQTGVDLKNATIAQRDAITASTGLPVKPTKLVQKPERPDIGAGAGGGRPNAVTFNERPSQPVTLSDGTVLSIPDGAKVGSALAKRDPETRQKMEQVLKARHKVWSTTGYPE